MLDVASLRSLSGLPRILALTLCLMSPVDAAAPPTRTVHVVDTIFGTAVPDPYRWLEKSDDPQVQKWTAAQYDHFRLYVDAFEDKELIKDELTRFLSTGSIGQPQVIKNRYFTERRDGDQNHLVLFVRDGLLGRE